MKMLLTSLMISFIAGFAFPLSAQSVSSRDMVQSISNFIPCANGGAGEMVSGDLLTHAIIHTNKDGIVTKMQFHPQGGVLIGQTTGTRFQANGLTNFIMDNPAGTFTDTFVNRYHLVGMGGVQFKVFETIHVTVNANGDVTADVNNFTFECK